MASYVEKLREQRRKEKLAREYSHIPQEQFNNPVGDAITQLGSGVKERIGALGRSATTLGDLASWQQAGRNLGEVNNMLTADPTLAMDAISPIGIVGMFAGKGARTANLAMLAKAEEMAKAGIPDSQIWKETGWALDTPDKLPRFEIPDNTAMYRGTYPASSAYADRAMHHPELMKGYPDAGAIRFDSNADVAGGSYANQGADEVISIGGKEGVDSASTALHELQHAIQQREGFARGGSPEMFTQADEARIAADALSWKKELLRKRKEMPNADWSAVENAAVQDYQKLGAMDMLPSREARDLALQPYVLHGEKYHPDDLKQVEDLVKMYGLDKRTTPYKPTDIYQRLAGEAEARLTQARMNLTPEQRLAKYPYDPEYFQGATGVNLKDLIVRKDGGTAMSIPNLDIPSLMTDAEKSMLQYELSKIPKKPALSLKDLAIGGGALAGGGLAGYYGIGAME